MSDLIAQVDAALGAAGTVRSGHAAYAALIAAYDPASVRSPEDDKQDRHVAPLSFAVCCWPLDVAEPLRFRPDSRLARIVGSRNESGRGVYDYVFDGRGFAPASVAP